MKSALAINWFPPGIGVFVQTMSTNEKWPYGPETVGGEMGSDFVMQCQQN